MTDVSIVCGLDNYYSLRTSVTTFVNVVDEIVDSQFGCIFYFSSPFHFPPLFNDFILYFRFLWF